MLQRECERAWAALGTEDRLRKKERNTVRQVQQFIYSLAREHRAGRWAATRSRTALTLWCLISRLLGQRRRRRERRKLGGV
ncbi:unnamed protein product [Effrenium voratum]|nr:unnamed protein product [Effrenium voratum]